MTTFETLTRAYDAYARVLRMIVMFLAGCAALAVVIMMVITSLDVIMRAFGSPMRGSYDIVKIAGALAIACALPYTTAVKGHVAVEYFFQKLSHAGRIIVDTLVRLIVMNLFIFLTWANIQFGERLRINGEVTPTLEIPVYWIPYVIAGACGLVVLVKIHHLLHPGKEMIKP